MSTHRIVSIETDKLRGKHSMIVAVRTQDEYSLEGQRWTLKAILEAMNRAERFYTEAANGRRARVQRYLCASCGKEHIRTHVGDQAIHRLHNLPPL